MQKNRGREMLKRAKQFVVTFLVLTLALGLVGCAPKQSEAPKTEDGKKVMTTAELKNNLGKSDWVIVDTRINDAFNGWKLEGVARGGHIKGATDFSAYWLDVDDKNKEQRLDEDLKVKGISMDKNVVLYDANGKDAKKVLEYLKGKGFTKLYLYDVKEWAKDSTLEMVSYPNYQMIVPAEWVKNVLDGKNPDTFQGGNVKVFEVSWGDETTSYNKGHIPGAVHINTDEIESPPLWSINSDDKLLQFAANNGLTPDMTVILEGDNPMASYRLGAIMKYLGVKDVRVLNGGFNSWVRAGYEADTKSYPKQAVASFGPTAPVNKGYIVDINGAKEILADKANSRLVDIRSWDEHIGKITGYSDLKYKGRPAGAVFGHAGSDPNHLEDFRNLDNTMRNGDEILAMWKEWGILPEQRLSFFCGSGWRAAEVLIYADVMGLKNISLYSNGWYEWSSNPKNPVEVGEPKR
jgi:3-mercaptopyruvate sulfurtransferase SseA